VNRVIAGLPSEKTLLAAIRAFLSARKQRELAASASPDLALQVLPAGTLVNRFLTEHSQHVDFPTPTKKEWVLTKEAFDGFLARLDLDRDKAGEKYESVRQKLLKYFQWRGSDECDVEADETINRVARRIEEGENIYNLNGYIFGVAKMIHSEWLKVNRRKLGLDEAKRIEVTPVDDEDPEGEERRACFDRCLRYLTDEDREAVIEYYQFEKGKKIQHRKKLAERFGISLNALRIKAHRKRGNLEACVRECLGHLCS
jgi:DNA-directed RNA polymerase specialized sigma24 family protein